ncbi:heme ABC transporter ATP-binding protein [Sansalvadorimonas sp. 2012CJ34-2]|uniref:Heme ABC transporter ATP-binding protein n=1 Tax=Parendozoicomonas callyspongiae TaxID=2942213 RepID=A0ABT0PBT5_9GAMM|nr:heme ABC transporter ATP-binding protein [Sansalvadorimonas sp. 2012CJ34-2]MCL6268847.1 heme ABC transporter ATP-binding protein [Sansalvadorimonas sp. 2012CJ34-2]
MDGLDVKNVSVRLGNHQLLEDVSFLAEPGEVVAILGPNGAGKTTLFRVITDELKPDSGNVLLHGTPVQYWAPEQRAQVVGILPQSSSLNFPFTVQEVVLLGRSPCSTSSEQNDQYVKEALEKVDAWHLQDRNYTTLSGGEKQRVHLARVLVQIWTEPEQGARLLLLDEPTSALDPAHQHQTLRIAREFARHRVAVVVILHDLNLASQYADRLVLLSKGRLQAHGKPEKVLTKELLKQLLDIDVCILPHPVNGNPVVLAE